MNEVELHRIHTKWLDRNFYFYWFTRAFTRQLPLYPGGWGSSLSRDSKTSFFVHLYISNLQQHFKSNKMDFSTNIERKCRKKAVCGSKTQMFFSSVELIALNQINLIRMSNFDNLIHLRWRSKMKYYICLQYSQNVQKQLP